MCRAAERPARRGARRCGRARSDVLGQMLAGPGAGDEQDVGREVEQPGQRDLRRGRTQARAEVGEDGTREDGVLDAAWPAQRAERHECDALRGAFVQEVERALIGEVEQVLHADDLGLVDGSAQVLCRYVAEADPVDQSFVAGLDERGELRVEAASRVWIRP